MVYFNTQSEALEHVFNHTKKKGWEPNLPDRIWTEHVNYGTTVKYDLPMTLIKTGNPARYWLHISLYRMESGKYELTHYFA